MTTRPTSSTVKSLKQPKGYIWINNTNILSKSEPHELGHGASKTVSMSEYSNFGFDINEIQGDDFDYSKYAIARIEPKDKRPTFTDGEMRSMHDELELQMEFAGEGKATRILGLLLKFPDESFVVAYTEADILRLLLSSSNKPRVCYILMERCNFVRKSGPHEGRTMSIWDISKNPLKVVQELIYCINHIANSKKMIFYDFKEMNVCVSPENNIIALDFDRYFCEYIHEIDWSYYDIRPASKSEIVNGYMFLLFTCEYYKNTNNPDPKIISVLHEGIKLFKIDKNLEQICRFSKKGRRNLEHYLIHRGDTIGPSFVQYIQTKYLDQMEKIATPSPGGGARGLRRRTRLRRRKRRGTKTKKRY